MKKISSYLFISIAMIAAVSCNNTGLKKTKSGLLYKIISDGKGEPVKRGQFLKFEYSQKVHDSVLNSSANGMPAYVRIDSVGPMYSPVEIFGLLRKGDSAVVIMLADSLVNKMHGQLPPFMKKKDKIVLTLKVLDVFVSEDLVSADRQKILDGEKDKEIKQIQDYLSKNSITNIQKTNEGVFYQILTPGTGPKVDSGKTVSIKYTGYTFDGKPFDSNVDSTKQIQAHPMSVFEFKAGVSGAIEGMVKTITQFKKGDKGKMYIPSMLGYGAQGAGGAIKPFENLIFEIEVVDVTDAPKQTERPGSPQLTPEQMKRIQEQMKRTK